jgi:hypothetical protein
MSNAFTNFLTNVGSGLFGGSDASMKDYQHANRLYVQNNYARAPKVNFLYFVNFNINQGVIIDKTWEEKRKNDVGLLVKRVDLPKFTIGTETLNQYNRRTVVQTKLTYGNVQIEFHDDNSDITTDLWKNYYQYYYMDSVYGEIKNKERFVEYGDTKYSDKSYAYGLDNFQKIPFFDSIDVFLMHKGHGVADFTKISLVNPMIVDWTHDSVNQDEAGRTMTNKMTVAYESVVYRKGKIIKGRSPAGFAPVYYDISPSPLGVGSSGNIFGAGGIIDGADSIFGEDGLLATASSPADLLGVALKTKQLVDNIGKISKGKALNELATLGAGVIGGIAAGALQPARANNPNFTFDVAERTGIVLPKSPDQFTAAVNVNLTTKK